MSRKRQKTAEVLATWTGDGGYEVVPQQRLERMYRTGMSRTVHSAWYPENVSTDPFALYPYWNHVDLALMDTLNRVPEGSSGAARMSNKISVNKIDLKIHFHLGHYGEVLTVSGAQTQAFDVGKVRCVLLLDTMASLGTMDITDVAAPPYGQFNPTYFGPANCLQTFLRSNNTRYRVLADEEACPFNIHTDMVALPSFNNVSGTGTMTNNVLYKHDFGQVEFRLKHTFAKPLTVTYTDAGTEPRDHRFVCLWTIGELRSGDYSRSITTHTSGRLYYTDA